MTDPGTTVEVGGAYFHRHHHALARRDVAVEAVGRRVQGAVVIPADVHVRRIEAGVLDLAVRLDPVDALAVLAPKPVRVFDAFRVPFEIRLVVDQRVFLPRRLDAVDMNLGHDVLFPPTGPGARMLLKSGI